MLTLYSRIKTFILFNTNSLWTCITWNLTVKYRSNITLFVHMVHYMFCITKKHTIFVLKHFYQKICISVDDNNFTWYTGGSCAKLCLCIIFYLHVILIVEFLVKFVLFFDMLISWTNLVKIKIEMNFKYTLYI